MDAGWTDVVGKLNLFTRISPCCWQKAEAGAYLCAMLEQTLRRAVEAGAQELQKYFRRRDLETAVKAGGVNDLVTEADYAAEKAIISTIKEAFPTHEILSEEAGKIEATSEYKWIIDPLDGTINFSRGISICCVSIGIEKEGKMVMGAVYSPFLDEYFFAERGRGAYLNGERIRVSEGNDVWTSCLVTGFPYHYINTPNGPVQVFERLVTRGVPVRRLGSAALDLCWVACGRFDGFYEHKLNAWDSAAGFIIVEEAGGVVTDLNGDPYIPYKPGICATNGILHDQLLAVIQDEAS